MTTPVVAGERCEHPGCERIGSECYLPDTSPENPPDAIYCAEHAHGAGFCHGCGNFWGGVESFEFSPSRLCDDCRSSERRDIARDDDEEDEPWWEPR